jgi:DNA helicase-2/ATP-dependent DNA helicase PcrA
LQQVNTAIDTLMGFWKDGADPTLLQVLRYVAEHNLLEIPDALQANASGAIEKAAVSALNDDDYEDRQTERALAIEAFLTAIKALRGLSLTA